MPNTSKNPTISIISANYNHGEFIREALDSVLLQKFGDYEYIIVDGASTDNSVEIIKEYAAKHPHIRWISEPDSGCEEAMQKGMKMARGRYIMISTSTDGYLSRNWLARVAETLDNDPSIALVWGNPQNMGEDGSLGTVVWPEYLQNPPPQKEQWCFAWLSALENAMSPYKCPLPELNYCVRSDIYLSLIGDDPEFPELNDIDQVYRFSFRFGRSGFMPYHLPIVANFGRTHRNRSQYSDFVRENEKKYFNAYRKYHAMLASGACAHYIRDGSGNPIMQVTLS